MEKYCPRCSQRYDDGQQRYCLNDGALLSLPDSYRLVGNTLDGKYRMDAMVGIGGFGAVYSAYHLSLDRQVAFKILQPNVALNTPAAVKLFESEAKTVARLSHENIVKIHDAGRTMDGLSYIAMEWLEGHTLNEELKACEQLGFERTAEILRQVAAALAFAHAKRVVHRDLKPDNVMLVKGLDGSDQVKVVDFGIAKILSSTAGSMVSRVMGTPYYASPEQNMRGSQIDGRADIYALGVMLYEMLTGRLPFDAPNAEELIRLKLHMTPPSLRDLLPNAPAAVEELLQRMMKVDPNQRPQKVGDIPSLFEAAYKTPVDVSQATTVVEIKEKMGESEIQRIAMRPHKQPDQALLSQRPQQDLAEKAEYPPHRQVVEESREEGAHSDDGIEDGLDSWHASTTQPSRQKTPKEALLEAEFKDYPQPEQMSHRVSKARSPRHFRPFRFLRADDTSHRMAKARSPRHREPIGLPLFLLSLLAIIGLIVLFYLFAGSRFFALKGVDVVRLEAQSGVAPLLEAREVEEIVRSSVLRGVLKADLEKIREELKKNPLIREVEVTRLLPDGLRVSVIERRPVALARRGNSIMCVDDEGVMFGASLHWRGGDVPLINGLAEGGEDAKEINRHWITLYKRLMAELDQAERGARYTGRGQPQGSGGAQYAQNR